MAQTLAELRREFAALKIVVAAIADEGEKLEHNLGQHRELLSEGFKALGLRIHELRDGGAQGTKLPDFMTDHEVVVMVQELNRQRQAAKKEAARARQLETHDYVTIRSRMAALRAALTAEVTTRTGKFSSKMLRINQSVQQMTALQGQVEDYARGGDPDYAFISDHIDSYAPDWYDRLYTDLLEEELAKSRVIALSAQQQMLAKRMLDLKLMGTANNKAKALFIEVQKQAKLAERATKAQVLSDARKAADEAWIRIKELVDPYEKAMRDAKIIAILSHSQDKDKVTASYHALVDVKSQAKAEVDKIKAQRIKV